MDIARAQEILDYWFTKDGTGDMDKWFMKSSEYDAEIKEKFGDLLKEAESGKGFGWLVSKDSFVAYIILMDQFSRHIYRGTANAYKNDVATILFTHAGFELYLDELKGYELMFAFMPYMHSEKNIARSWEGTAWYRIMQTYGKEKEKWNGNEEEKGDETENGNEKVENGNEKENGDETEEGNQETSKEWDIVKQMEPHVMGHRNTLERFDRFPKRNKVLGRISTSEEIKYMDDTTSRTY